MGNRQTKQFKNLETQATTQNLELQKQQEPPKPKTHRDIFVEIMAKATHTEEEVKYITQFVLDNIPNNIFDEEFLYTTDPKHNHHKVWYQPLFYCLLDKFIPGPVLEFINSGHYDPKKMKPSHETKYTYLVHAIIWGNKELIKAIISKGDYGPNILTYYNDTALIYALYKEMPDIATLILESKDCKPEQMNHGGYSALSYAIRNKYDDISLQIIDRIDAMTIHMTNHQFSSYVKEALTCAVTMKNEKIIRKLFETFPYEHSEILQIYKQSIKKIRLIIIENFDFDDKQFLIEKYGPKQVNNISLTN